MISNKQIIKKPEVKYGQNKLQVNTILYMSSKRKLPKVNLNF